MIIADLHLAQRLEANDALLNVWYAEELARLKPETTPRIERIGDGTVVFAGADLPLSRAVGFGMNQGVTSRDLDDVEEFYRRRDSSVQLDLCPLAHPSLMRLLGARGYRFQEFLNIWVLPIEEYRTLAVATDLEVREASASEGTVWMQTVNGGFASVESGEENAGIDNASLDDDFFLPFVHHPQVHCLLALFDGQAAGAGTMAINQGLAGLFGTSTLPRYRNRGAQSALLQARLALALEAGCDLATVGTTPGSNSQRNVQRAGFQLAYTKVQMVKRWD